MKKYLAFSLQPLAFLLALSLQPLAFAGSQVGNVGISGSGNLITLQTGSTTVTFPASGTPLILDSEGALPSVTTLTGSDSIRAVLSSGSSREITLQNFGQTVTPWLSGTAMSLTTATALTLATGGLDAWGGDLTFSGSLATFNTVTTGATVGDATHTVTITYDAKGRILSTSTNQITALGIGALSLTGSNTLTGTTTLGSGGVMTANRLDLAATSGTLTWTGTDGSVVNVSRNPFNQPLNTTDDPTFASGSFASLFNGSGGYVSSAGYASSTDNAFRSGYADYSYSSDFDTFFHQSALMTNLGVSMAGDIVTALGFVTASGTMSAPSISITGTAPTLIVSGTTYYPHLTSGTITFTTTP